MGYAQAIAEGLASFPGAAEAEAVIDSLTEELPPLSCATEAEGAKDEAGAVVELPAGGLSPSPGAAEALIDQLDIVSAKPADSAAAERFHRLCMDMPFPVCSAARHAITDWHRARGRLRESWVAKLGRQYDTTPRFGSAFPGAVPPSGVTDLGWDLRSRGVLACIGRWLTVP